MRGSEVDRAVREDSVGHDEFVHRHISTARTVRGTAMSSSGSAAQGLSRQMTATPANGGALECDWSRREAHKDYDDGGDC
jgi:hypothetical protein